MDLNILNTKGEKTGKINLPVHLFGLKENESLLSQALRVYQQRKRQGTSSTKGRGEVQGSTRKIYRQKGTGKARHGSIRSPIFIKGGIVFGPKPRNYDLHLPSKMKKLALLLSLSQKAKEGKITICSDFEKTTTKTKEAFQAIIKLKLEPKKKSLIFIGKNLPEKTKLALQNIALLSVQKVENLNAFEILMNENLIFTENALEYFIKANPEKDSLVKKDKLIKTIKKTKPKNN